MEQEKHTLEWMMNFVANRVRTLREAKGIAAHTMSLDLGQNNSYINKIENQKAKPSLEGLFYICEYFGITLSEFFDNDTNAPDMVHELIETSKSLEQESMQLLIDMAVKLRK